MSRSTSTPSSRTPLAAARHLATPMAACLTAVALCAAPAAQAASAAAPAFLTVDHSSAGLLDKAAAQAFWAEQLPAATARRLAKLYPVKQWGFLSQAEGGFTADKTCVVTARVMLLPRSGKLLQLKPEKTATSFDAKPGASQEQCQALAREKLAESAKAVLSSLIAEK